MSDQKKPSAAAVRVRKEFLSAACDEGYHRNLEILVDAEIRELIEALEPFVSYQSSEAEFTIVVTHEQVARARRVIARAGVSR